MNKLLVVVVMCGIIAGCAWTKQAVQDYNTGKNTPLVNGETSPQTEASTIGNTVSSLPIPFAAPIGLGVTFLAGLFLTWKRGVSIRTIGAPSNTAGTTVSIFTEIEQFVANVFAGTFTTTIGSPTNVGSIWQRIWKVALATVASGVTVAAANPQVLSYLTAHPFWDSIFVAISSGIAGLEKGLSNVPVVTASTTPPTPTSTT